MSPAATRPSGVTAPGFPLERPALHEHVRAFILEGLVAGRWEPGDRIVERRIAVELGTSQAPVREALRDLEAMELLTSTPNKGARVQELTVEQLRDVYVVRAALERRAVMLAAPRLAGNTAALEGHLLAMRRAAAEGDVDGQALHGVAFHRAIVHACGNPVLIRHWDGLGVEVWTRLSLRWLRTELHENAEDHEEIAEGLLRGDPHLGRLMERHVMDYARASKST
ncbi:GntR family transcriptional regulator [Kitasatospora sp. NPDC057965]|uniref:GntR family transcriptional regulator n=1 Tax=Kitasatospora sp. NPDC057965 TaxID=3346291 RepID=UPI0036DF5D8E